MKKSIIILCIGLTFYKSFAQPAIEWQNTIGGSLEDHLFSIQQSNDGGYILGGFSNSNISGDKTENCLGESDYWIVKLDSLGNIQWQNTIGGDNSDALFSLQQTIDGGYILGGYSNSNISSDKTEDSNGDYDYWIVKVNSTGNIQWQNTIGGSGNDRLYSISETTDGGYILGGFSYSDISGDKTENSNGVNDYWVIRIDGSGNIQWQNTIGGNFDDWLLYIKETSDEGYLLGGYSSSNISGDKSENSKGGWDYWIVKIDSVGNIQWQKTIGGSSDDLLFLIDKCINGGYIFGGYSNSNISGDKTENSKGSYDYWIVKTDNFGNILWQRTIGGSGKDELYAIQQTIDGGFILGGLSNSNISGDKTENNKGGDDYWIVKTDSIGNIEWQKTIGGSNNEKLYSVVKQTINGGYIVGGYTSSNISGDKTENSNGLNDYWIVKLSALTSIEETVSIADLAIFPNPSNTEINISFILTDEEEIKIELYNSLGQIVKRISEEKFSPGKNQIIISTENLSKGIYHFIISMKENIVVKRLVKI